MIEPLFSEATFSGRMRKHDAEQMDDVASWVVSAASAVSGHPPVTLVRDIREHHIVLARQAAMIVARRLNCSLASIGRVLCRDHTTVRYAVEEAKHNPAFLAERQPYIDEIEAYLSRDSSAPINGAAMRLAEATGAVERKARVAPFPPGADRLILAGVSKHTVVKLYRHTGWVV